MFFRKKPRQDLQLMAVVQKVTDTGFVFWNISDDLAHSANDIMKSTTHVQMSYGYARRAAAAALYVQGLMDRDSYAHAEAMFKALQQKTGKNVEFQERAAADSIDFMQSYHHIITGMPVKKLIQIAREYEVPEGRRNDADLFEQVFDTIHREEVGEKEKEVCANPLGAAISALEELSARNTEKTVTVWLAPLNESWFHEFHFSDQESLIADQINTEIYELMDGLVTMSSFAFQEVKKPKNSLD